MTIHPTALVDPAATLTPTVEIGPYAIIEAGVRLGQGCRVMAHAYLAGDCIIGDGCEIHMGAVIGHLPQITGHTGPGGGVTVGPGTIIREHATIHRASQPGQRTVIGEQCFLMNGCHVGHDCQVGHRVIIANGVLLAGHVTVEDRAFLSGNVVVHQFVRIGRLVMVGGGSRVAKDVPPFMLVVGDSQVRGLNVVGMRRAGLSAEDRQVAKDAYRILYRSGLNVSHAVERLKSLPGNPVVTALIDFISQSRRGICPAGPRGRRLASLQCEDKKSA